MARSGGKAALALALEREVDHHDSVLLDDADEQDDADEGDQRELGIEELQRQQRAEPGRGQRGNDRERMRQALVEDAEHDVDGNERGDDQQRLRADRLAKGARIAGIFRMQRIGHVHLRDRLLDAPCRLLDWRVLVETEADGDGGELALVVDHERREPPVDLGHGGERNLGIARRRSHRRGRDRWDRADIAGRSRA